MTITQQSLIRSSLLTGTLMTSLALGACSSSDSGGGSSPVKKDQTITFPAPMTLGITEKAELTATASSKLAVAYTSTTPEVCSVSEKTVLAKAVGNCTIVAKQAGNKAFKPAEDISVTFAVVPLAVVINADDVSFGKAGKVLLSGKQVSKNLKATLAGVDVPVISTGDYMAEITVTPEMVGDLPLVIKDGNKVVYDDVIKVALPEATGDSFTVKKTGATKCGNLTENNIDCSDKDKLGEFYQTNQDGEVKAGVNPAYIKVVHQVQKDGKKFMEYCVYDKVAGLMWEQKADEGLRNKDWKYTWYDSNSATNGGVAGTEAPDEDTCNGTLAKCNSENYIKQLNAMNYCGHNDWRMPTSLELLGIRDFGKTEAPLADPIFNLFKGDGSSEGSNDGLYMTSSSRGASKALKDAKAQSSIRIDFSNHTFIYISPYKNATPYSILATRSVK